MPYILTFPLKFLLFLTTPKKVADKASTVKRIQLLLLPSSSVLVFKGTQHCVF